MKKQQIERENCIKCMHYYVTWEKRFPHGCRALGFKGKVFPSSTVRRSSGMNCMFFKPKVLVKKPNSI